MLARACVRAGTRARGHLRVSDLYAFRDMIISEKITVYQVFVSSVFDVYYV